MGVLCQLQPCTVMAPGLPPDVDPRPLECCTSAWQSALSDLPSVDNLVQEELQQGWIREVTGGLPALRQQYRLCAVGKLGLVQAPPRLAVWWLTALSLPSRRTLCSLIAPVTPPWPTSAGVCLWAHSVRISLPCFWSAPPNQNSSGGSRPAVLSSSRQVVSVSDTQLWGEGLQLLLGTCCWPSLSTSASHRLRESWPYDLCG